MEFDLKKIESHALGWLSSMSETQEFKQLWVDAQWFLQFHLLSSRKYVSTM